MNEWMVKFSNYSANLVAQVPDNQYYFLALCVDDEWSKIFLRYNRHLIKCDFISIGEYAHLKGIGH